MIKLVIVILIVFVIMLIPIMLVKSEERKRLAHEKAEREKRLSEEKAAKAAEEKRRAEQRVAEEKRLAEEKAFEELIQARQKAAEKARLIALTPVINDYHNRINYLNDYINKIAVKGVKKAVENHMLVKGYVSEIKSLTKESDGTLILDAYGKGDKGDNHMWTCQHLFFIGIPIEDTELKKSEKAYIGFNVYGEVNNNIALSGLLYLAIRQGESMSYKFDGAKGFKYFEKLISGKEYVISEGAPILRKHFKNLEDMKKHFSILDSKKHISHAEELAELERKAFLIRSMSSMTFLAKGNPKLKNIWKRVHALINEDIKKEAKEILIAAKKKPIQEDSDNSSKLNSVYSSEEYDYEEVIRYIKSNSSYNSGNVFNSGGISSSSASYGDNSYSSNNDWIEKENENFDKLWQDKLEQDRFMARREWEETGNRDTSFGWYSGS